MEPLCVGERLRYQGKVVFDGFSEKEGRLIYIDTADRHETIALSTKLMKRQERIPEETSGKRIDVVGDFSGEITDAREGRGPKIPLLNIRCFNLFVELPSKGKIYD